MLCPRRHSHEIAICLRTIYGDSIKRVELKEAIHHTGQRRGEWLPGAKRSGISRQSLDHDRSLSYALAVASRWRKK